MSAWSDKDELLWNAMESGHLDSSLDGDEDLVKAFHAHQELESLFKLLRQPAEGQINTEDSSGQPANIGRYQVHRLLGQGAFGMVYLSDDPELDRSVAIKVPRPQRFSSDSDADRFLEEARLAAQLKHPGIVTVYDVGRDGNICYIVMEYVEGQSLQELTAATSYSPDESAKLVAGVADALHYAHKKGFVHRDLKPANILIDDQGQPLITDFGLAVSEDSQREYAGQVAGTPAYMSPEQVRGEAHRLDGRTDIWSLGVILYEMLTGRHPFFKEDVASCLDDIQHREPKPPRQIDDSIPAILETVCLRCLSKDVTGRFSTAADIASALRQAPTIRKGQKSTDSGVTSATPGLTPVRRIGAFLLVSMLVSLGVGISIFLFMTRKPEDVEAHREPGEMLTDLPQTASDLPDAESPKHRSLAEARSSSAETTPVAAKGSVSPGSAQSRLSGKPKETGEMPLVPRPQPIPKPGPVIENSIGMKLVLIPPGEFMMGSPMSEKGRGSDEHQHLVRITKAFYMGVYEVTQTEWEQVLGINPSAYGPRGSRVHTVLDEDIRRFPVDKILHWGDAEAFCRRLSERLAENEAGRQYRLPTEAEWEYACRGGTTTAYHFGNSLSPVQANCRGLSSQEGASDGLSLNRPTTVGFYEPNAWGLYDMHGNVSEMCADWYGEGFYLESPLNDPRAPSYPVRHQVIRGGGWLSLPDACRSASRQHSRGGHSGTGFRVAADQLPLRQSTEQGPPFVWPANAPPLAIAPFDAATTRDLQEAWAKYLNTPVELTNSLGMTFVLIPPGEFEMGSTAKEIAGLLDEAKKAGASDEHLKLLRSEAPQHRVRLTRPFYIGQCEVTENQYERVRSVPLRVAVSALHLPERRTKDERDSPVDRIYVDIARSYAVRLTLLEEEKAHSRVYRLPTEAEWEYACRAGTTTRYSFGDHELDLGNYAWWNMNSDGTTHPVAQKKPNAFGLYDMHGNVMECSVDQNYSDWFLDDPQSPAGTRFIVNRGGSYETSAAECRSAARYSDSLPEDGLRYSLSGNHGIRLILVPLVKWKEFSDAGSKATPKSTPKANEP